MKAFISENIFKTYATLFPSITAQDRISNCFQKHRCNYV